MEIEIDEPEYEALLEWAVGLDRISIPITAGQLVVHRGKDESVKEFFLKKADTLEGKRFYTWLQ